MAASGASSPAAGQPDIVQRFIPQDLADKLEAARRAGAMSGERRLVTILFCDVMGSTAAAEQLDPEEWTEIINGAFEHMIRPVYRYEGTVARLMGDAILAFFGAPIAHEDDPQRAILAGLEIVDGIRSYRETVETRWHIDIDVRVGINTGLVVVGAVGSDLRMEYTALGDAINVAARMEQTAVPGTVRIAGETYKLVAPLFEVEALGGIRVKGKAEPVPAYRVLGRKAAAGRPHGIAGLEAPLIGRAGEQDQMEHALARLESGVGGIFFLVGEAGLGKSRLIQEIKSGGAENRSVAWYETLSHSYETQQPYALFRRLVRAALGARADERPDELRAKIGALTQSLPDKETATAGRVLGSLFGLPGPGGEPVLEGETFKGLLYTLMSHWWQAQARAGPVTLVCDDLHWTDPASLALLEHLFPLAERLPLLFLCAMRPERGSAAWAIRRAVADAHPHRFHEIRLRSLSAAESGALVDGLLDIVDLPAELRQRIMTTGAGNPYFVEEIVRSLLERGLLVQDEGGAHWQPGARADELKLPNNLRTLLVARIDRLAEAAQRTLQVAAVVGRSFYYRVLRPLVDLGRLELDDNLLALQRSGLILEAARQPEQEYLFRHALTQEAAYSTILRRERRVTHRRVAQTMEALFSDRRQELAGTLAEHYFQGLDYEQALHYYTMAGDEAFRLYASREAIRHYERAIACAAKVESDGQTLIHLYGRRGRSYELDDRFNEALADYQELLRLGRERGDQRLRLAGLTAMCVLHATQTPLYDPPRARELGKTALSLVRQLGDRATQARVLWAMLLVEAWGGGDVSKAEEYGHRSLQLARELGLKEQLGYTQNNLVNVYLLQDKLNLAHDSNLQVIAAWRELDNLPMLADAYTMRQHILQQMGELAAMEEAGLEGLRLSRSIDNVWNQLNSHYYLANYYLDVGNCQRALEMIAAADALADEAGFFHRYLRLDRLRLALVVGDLESMATLAASLEEVLDEVVPFMRSWFAGPIAQAQIALARLDQAQRVLEESYRAPDLAASILYTSYLGPAELALLLAQNKPEQAVERAEKLLTRCQEVGFDQLRPDMLWLQGRARSALTQPEAARATLLEALEASESMGERRVRWRILGDLARLEAGQANVEAARTHRDAALAVIGYIAAHCPADLREIFLAWPAVQAIESSARIDS
ncbi:MAG: adenylate/guanylate cyclase domain-containing protein [Candidatus Promineifilaceae bacterium]|nr:adenylate/guanylate cyclase domain-containing protein [Candidatus Promineifilaceae bacterium]